MRSNMLKNNYSHIGKAIELIETGIREKLKPIEISKKLQTNTMLDYKYFNAVFNMTTGYTLAQYIRRRSLAVIYGKWKNERPILHKTSMYERYPRFREQFHKEFGFTAEEAMKKGYTESQLQAKLDISNLIQMFQVLEQLMSMNIVIDYDFGNKQKLTLKINKEELLLRYLRLDIFLLPGVRIEEFQGMSKDDQALYVIAHERWRQAECKSLVVAMREECEDMKKRLINYDCCRVGDVLVVKPEVQESLKPVFLAKCDELVPYIYSVLHNQKILQTLKTELNTIEESKDDIAALAQALKLSLPETRELLWTYLTQGYLRVGRISKTYRRGR